MLPHLEAKFIFIAPPSLDVLKGRLVARGTETQEITPAFVVGETVIVVFNHQSQEVIFLGDGRMWAQVTP